MTVTVLEVLAYGHRRDQLTGIGKGVGVLIIRNANLWHQIELKVLQKLMGLRHRNFSLEQSGQIL
jgi:hypothetical protein